MATNRVLGLPWISWRDHTIGPIVLIWMVAICIHDQGHNKKVTLVIPVHASSTYKMSRSRVIMMMLDKFVECFQKENTHMADLPNPNNATRRSSGIDNNDNDVRFDQAAPPSTPRWVYVSAIIVLVVVVLVVILHLTGGGLRRHGGQTPPSSVIEQRVQQP